MQKTAVQTLSPYIKKKETKKTKQILNPFGGDVLLVKGLLNNFINILKMKKLKRLFLIILAILALSIIIGIVIFYSFDLKTYGLNKLCSSIGGIWCYWPSSHGVFTTITSIFLILFIMLIIIFFVKNQSKFS